MANLLDQVKGDGQMVGAGEEEDGVGFFPSFQKFFQRSVICYIALLLQSISEIHIA